MDRLERYLELRTELGERFATRPRSEWIERLERADVPYATVNTIEETLADPQVAALGTRFTTHHPTEGPVSALHSPLHVDGERITPPLPPPTLGEHNGATWLRN